MVFLHINPQLLKNQFLNNSKIVKFLLQYAIRMNKFKKLLNLIENSKFKLVEKELFFCFVLFVFVIFCNKFFFYFQF